MHTGSLPLLSQHALPSKFLKPFSPWLNRYEHNIENRIACRQSSLLQSWHGIFRFFQTKNNPMCKGCYWKVFPHSLVVKTWGSYLTNGVSLLQTN